jgi:predicted nucleic acid-binding protein
MLALPTVESPLGAGVFEDAIGLYRAARRQGLTMRSSVDCLIAACALRNGLLILHRDRDYPLLAKVSGLLQRAV